MSKIEDKDEGTTVAQKMLTALQQIDKALSELKAGGLPETLVMAYIQKRTKLSQRDIRLVLDALKEMNREMKK